MSSNLTVVDLAEASAVDRALIGGKAAVLADLTAARFSVPPGIVVTTGVLDDPQLDRRLAASVEGLGGERFAVMLDVLFSWAGERPELYWALMPSGLFELLAGEIEAVLCAAGTDPVMAAPGARAMLGSVTAVIEWWLRSGMEMPRERLVGYFADLAWRGGVGLPEGWLDGSGD